VIRIADAEQAVFPRSQEGQRRHNRRVRGVDVENCGARDGESEYTRQTKDGKPPKMSDCVLLNPETGRPFSRSGLNRSLGSLGNRLNI
jgi:hypothetical protein